MKIHNIEQGTEAWFSIKVGKMSASHAQAIASDGKGLETYIFELMAEYYSSAIKERYTNEDLERGNRLEDMARQFYEIETGAVIEEIGFAELDEYTGVSPDGLIKGENGGIEIKCMKDRTFLEYIVKKKISSEHAWQMQMQMLVMGWDFVDYVVFNPNMPKSIIIQRVKRDEDAHKKLLIGIESGKKRIKEIKSQIDTLFN